MAPAGYSSAASSAASGSSDRGPAGIDGDDPGGHVAGLRRGKEDGERGDFLGLPEALEHAPRQHGGLPGLALIGGHGVEEATDHGRLDGPGEQAVDAYAIGREVPGLRAGQRD